MCRMHNTTSFPNINNIYRHIFAACFFPSLSLSLVVLVHPPTWISLSASTGSRIDLAAPKKSMNYSLYNVWGIEQNKNIAQPTTTTANKQKKKRRWWTEEWQYKKYTNQTHYKQYLNILLSVWHNEHNRSSYLRVCYSLVWLFLLFLLSFYFLVDEKCFAMWNFWSVCIETTTTTTTTIEGDTTQYLHNLQSPGLFHSFMRELSLVSRTTPKEKARQYSGVPHILDEMRK